MADENLNPQNENIQEGDARRTLKLRPSTTTPAGSQLADPMHGETDTSNLDVLDDTQTRKTIKIKPLTPTAPQINIGALPQSPGATPLSGTQTRKTVVLNQCSTGVKQVVAYGICHFRYESLIPSARCKTERKVHAEFSLYIWCLTLSRVYHIHHS